MNTHSGTPLLHSAPPSKTPLACPPPQTAARPKLKRPSTPKKSSARSDKGEKDKGEPEHPAAQICTGGKALRAAEHATKRRASGVDSRNARNDPAATDHVPVSRAGVRPDETGKPGSGTAAAVTVAGTAMVSGDRHRPEQRPAVATAPLFPACDHIATPPPPPLPAVVTNTSVASLPRVRTGRLSARTKAAKAAAAAAAAAVASAAAAPVEARAESAAARPNGATPLKANGGGDPRWAQLVEASGEWKEVEAAPHPPASSHDDTKEASSKAAVAEVTARGGCPPLPAIVVRRRFRTNYNTQNTTTSAMTTSSSSPSSPSSVRRGRRGREEETNPSGSGSSGCSRTRGEEGGGDEGGGIGHGTGRERNDDVEMMMTAETNIGALEDGDDGDDDDNQDGEKTSARRRAEERRERRMRRPRSDRGSKREKLNDRDHNGSAGDDKESRFESPPPSRTAGGGGGGSGGGRTKGARLERKRTEAAAAPTATTKTTPGRGRGRSTLRRHRRGGSPATRRADHAAADAIAAIVVAANAAATAVVAAATKDKEGSRGVLVIPGSDDQHMSVSGELTKGHRTVMPVAGESASTDGRRMERWRGKGSGGGRIKASAQRNNVEPTGYAYAYSGAAVDNSDDSKAARRGKDEGRRENGKAASAASNWNSSAGGRAMPRNRRGARPPGVAKVVATAAAVSSSAVSSNSQSSPRSSRCSCPSDCSCCRPRSPASSCSRCKAATCSKGGSGGGGGGGGGGDGGGDEEDPQASISACVLQRSCWGVVDRKVYTLFASQQHPSASACAPFQQNHQCPFFSR